MRASPDDRLHGDQSGGSGVWKPLAIAGVVLAVVLIVWFSGNDDEAEPQTTEAPVTAEPAPEPEPLQEPELPPAEDIPVRGDSILAQQPQAEPLEPALPPLSESDDEARQALLEANVDAELEPLRRSENLIERGVAVIDGFSRGVIMQKLLPVAPPKEKFPVQQIDGELYMDPVGYRRYDSYVDAVDAVDTEVLVDSFHHLRPLIEEAYGQLGMDPEDLDNAIIRSLDRVLATPEIEERIPLARKSVAYIYADPSLEALSPLQKQLLRMGPENIRRIKQQARELREGLLATGSGR